MSIVCLASLKGGVGKTSLSVNLSHAFAHRGCRTLLIDLDPAGHATRFFRQATGLKGILNESPLARLFLPREVQQGNEVGREGSGMLVEGTSEENAMLPVRQDLELIPSGQELKHFLWGRGAQIFAKRFPQLLREFRYQYDQVVIDTPPDFNVLTRNAIASADLVAIPVDSSEMSIHSLEELIITARHIRRPIWAIVRTMVNKQAARTASLSTARLKERLALRTPEGSPDEDEVRPQYNIEDPKDFLRMLHDWEEAHGTKNRQSEESNGVAEKRSPLYLLRSLVYRTEQQNQLSYLGKTAFDAKSTSALAGHYVAVAREVEDLIAMNSDEDEEPYAEGEERERDQGEGDEPHDGDDGDRSPSEGNLRL